MSKAENRFQEAKHKRKTQRLIKDVWQRPELADDARFVGVQTGVHARPCSCFLCKRGENKRKNPDAKDYDQE